MEQKCFENPNPCKPVAMGVSPCNEVPTKEELSDLLFEETGHKKIFMVDRVD